MRLVKNNFFENGEYEKMPILFVPFCRIETATKVFKAIKKSKPKKLYVYSDGWREEKVGEKEKVEYLRKYVIDNVNWDCELFTKFEEKNRGLDSGMGTAVRWFFEQEEMGIVLEDDCMPTQSFFRFCSEILIKYKDEDKVSLVVGTNKTPKSTSANSYSFRRACDFPEEITQLWGFATWRRMFQKYVNPVPHLEEYKTKIKSEENSIDYEKYLINARAKTLISQTELVLAGKNNAADMMLKLSMLMNDKLFIIPDCNLITNIGFAVDGSGHDTFEYVVGGNLVPGEFQFPIQHPAQILSNPLSPNEFIRALYMPIPSEKEFWDLELANMNEIFSVYSFLGKSGLSNEEGNKLFTPFISSKLSELISISVRHKKFYEAQKYLYLAHARSLLYGERNFCSKCEKRQCLSACPTKSISTVKISSGEVIMKINRGTCEHCFSCMKTCHVVGQR